MLNGVAHVDGQLQSIHEPQIVRLRLFGDANTPNLFHYEIRPPELRRSTVIDPCKACVNLHGKGLILGIKPGKNTPGVHQQFDHFKGHPPPDRLQLLDPKNTPASTLPHSLQ